jgi:peptidoglycan/LPS O-acetylase OafA/YrhL
MTNAGQNDPSIGSRCHKPRKSRFKRSPERTRNSAQMTTNASAYRPDIDGLRALAVISVVLYHLRFRYLKGGFVGVDVFFVISGYLITRHVASDMEAGSFSFLSFYDRRIRRIFPALLVMLLGTVVFAYFLLLPGELIDYAKSLVASVCSASNLYFLLTAGYFNGGDKPLLHTWSLGVEEQFYMLLPPLLLTLRRITPAKIKPALLFISICSFLLSAAMVVRFPEATFYLLPTRAWELLVGSMVGLDMVRCPDRSYVRGSVGLLGAALIALAAVWYDTAMPFPGAAALLPCLGAAMVIAAGGSGRTPTDILLSMRPMVWIGLVSYSLYLWHVPIIVFIKCMTLITFGKVLPLILPFLSVPQAITLERDIVVIVLSFVFAFLSWRFVEQPFRHGRWRPTRSGLFEIAGIGSIVLATMGLCVVVKQGLPGRFAPRVVRIASQTEASEYRRGTCFVSGNEMRYDKKGCLADRKDRENWLLIGDSHAAMLAAGLAAVDPTINLMQTTATGCKPVDDRRMDDSRGCFEIMRYVYEDYLRRHRPDMVILAANWQVYDLDRLTSSIEYLKSISQKILVVGPIMQYDTPLPRLLATSVSSRDLSLVAAHRIRSYDDLDRVMKTMATNTWGVNYISYRDLLCPKGICLEWAAPDVPLQSDTSHLTDLGSVLVAQLFKHAGSLGR